MEAAIEFGGTKSDADTPTENAAPVAFRTRRGIPQLLGKACGFAAFPTGGAEARTST